MIGETISHYQVLDRLGRGGMGVIYRAVDTKLGRRVALKFLPDGISLDPGVLDRFAREARSAAALNPSNVIDVHANLAFTYIAFGQPALARKHWETVLQLPIPDAQIRALGDALFNATLAVTAGRPEDALAGLQSVPLELKNSLAPTALMTRGQAHLLLKQYKEAERDFRAVLARDSHGLFIMAEPLSQIGLAQTLAAAGNQAAARQEYDKALKHFDQADADLPLLRELKAERAKLGG